MVDKWVSVFELSHCPGWGRQMVLPVQQMVLPVHQQNRVSSDLQTCIVD